MEGGFWARLKAGSERTRPTSGATRPTSGGTGPTSGGTRPASEGARLSQTGLALLLGLSAALALTTHLIAQTAQPPRAGQRAVEPIKCWWRSTATAVVVGERFTVTLTCGLVETDDIKTVTNRDNLEPAALTLTPFEVVGGKRHEDVVSGPWRYLQYQYTVRLIGNEFFDRDIAIPSLGITYNVVSTARETEERERTYQLPPLRMRMVSLVPKDAPGVREPPPETFAAIEARRFRATSELVAAALAFGAALVLFAVAIARALRRARVGQRQETRTVTPRAVLSGALAATRALKTDIARDGWTPEVIARALGPLRLAAAVVLGRPLAQSEASDSPLREGQVYVPTGLLRRPVVVSAAAGADAVTRHLTSLSAKGQPPAPNAVDLEAIGESLSILSAARYGRNGASETTELDAALTRAEDAIRRLHLRSLWPGRRRPARPGAATLGPAWFR